MSNCQLNIIFISKKGEKIFPSVSRMCSKFSFKFSRVKKKNKNKQRWIQDNQDTERAECKLVNHFPHNTHRVPLIMK